MSEVVSSTHPIKSSRLEEYKREKTVVIGLGNTLQGDDGLGIVAAQLLSSRELPPGVHVQDLGTPGWGLVSWLEGWDRVYVIDAAQMGEIAGTWQRIVLPIDGPAADTNFIQSDGSLSLHEPGLADSLALAQSLDLLPETLVIYAIEPLHIGQGETLSPPVKEALFEVVEHLYNELWKGTGAQQI